MIQNGWFQNDTKDFWALHRDGKWTGLTLAKIHLEGDGDTYHLRFYPQDGSRKDYDIADVPNLESAMAIN